jgi:hypothetical protein
VPEALLEIDHELRRVAAFVNRTAAAQLFFRRPDALELGVETIVLRSVSIVALGPLLALLRHRDWSRVLPIIAEERTSMMACGSQRRRAAANYAPRALSLAALVLRTIACHEVW